MTAANLLCPDQFPANLIFFAAHGGQTARTDQQRNGNGEPANAPRRDLPEDPVASRLNELFAHKREEKAPEGFMNNFMEEFARRNYR